MNRKAGYAHTMVIFTLGWLGGVKEVFLDPAGKSWHIVVFFLYNKPWIFSEYKIVCLEKFYDLTWDN